MHDEINKKLAKIIGRFARNRNSDSHLSPELRLAEDLGVDSPRRIDILLDIEDHFGITIDESAFHKVTTVGELADFIFECGVKK